MTKWDGEERRSTMFNKDFYDKMMEVHGDLRHIVEWAKNHDSMDNERFEKTNIKVDWVTKVAYMGLGGLAIIQIVIGYLFK